MHLNMIEYDLQCNCCKSFKNNSLSTVQTNESISNLPEQELIKIMNDFRNIQCKTCGNKGNWKVLRISV